MTRPTSNTIQKFPELFRNSQFVSGVWRAKVVSVADPQNRGRIQVRDLKRHPAPASATIGVDAATLAGRIQTSAPTVEGEAGEGVPNPPGRFEGIPDNALPWAEPCFPFGGQKRSSENQASNGNVTDGFIMLPSVGSTVWIMFEQGWAGGPVWLGGWFGDGELPPEFTDPENIRLIKTPAGHLFIMDDGDSSSRVLLATTDDNGLNQDGTRIRFLELSDSGESLILQNAEGDDVQRLTMDRGTQTITIENGPDQTILINAIAGTTTIRNSASQSIVQGSGTTTITDGNSSITLTAAGAITISNGTTTITVDPAGNVSVLNPALLLLGTGAVQGVCLDSLITVIAAMVTKFNTHTHNGAVAAPPTPEHMTPPVIGVNSSSTVRAKL